MPPTPVDPMAEKCTHNLPPIRVGESLAHALMRLAARDDRALSEYIRLVLMHHAFGHGATVADGGGGVE